MIENQNGYDKNIIFLVGPLFGGSFGSNGAYNFSVPGLPPAAHALAKSGFLFDHGKYSFIKKS